MELEQIEGTVEDIIYENPDNGYTVFEISGGGTVTVVCGIVGELHAGESVVCRGKYENHATYGRQFHAQECETDMPKDLEAVYAFLASRSLPYIGAKTAEEIALSILAQIVQVKSARSLTEGFPPAILEAFRALQTPAVLATIVSRHGSTPREVGSKMLVLPEGRAVGSVGGGIMEYRIQQLAGKMLAGAAAPAQLADLTTDGTGDDAAIAACGGSMQVFLQRIEPEE